MVQSLIKPRRCCLHDVSQAAFEDAIRRNAFRTIRGLPDSLMAWVNESRDEAAAIARIEQEAEESLAEAAAATAAADAAPAAAAAPADDKKRDEDGNGGGKERPGGGSRDPERWRPGKA